MKSSLSLFKPSFRTKVSENFTLKTTSLDTLEALCFAVFRIIFSIIL